MASASIWPRTLARELHDVDRLGAFFDIIHQDPVLVASETDCRALGRGRRRLSGGQFPGGVDRMERQISRRRARLLEGRRRHACRIGHRLDRQQRSLQRRSAASRTPASISSPRTTASRSTIWSATTRNTTRPTAKTITTANDDNRSWNCGVEGPTDDPESIAFARRQKRNFLATLLLLRVCPCLRRGMSSAAPSRATTMPTARTTKSPGSTGRILDQDLQEFAPPDRFPPRSSRFPPPPLVPGTGYSRRGLQGHRLVRSHAATGERAVMGGRGGAQPGDFHQRGKFTQPQCPRRTGYG